MRKRPISITVVGWLFVGTGCIGIVAALVRWLDPAALGHSAGPGAHPDADAALASTSGFLAALGGVLALRGANWARWLLVAWMGFHVVLSLWHSALELLVHVAFFAPLLFLLLRPSASAFFRRARVDGP